MKHATPPSQPVIGSRIREPLRPRFAEPLPGGSRHPDGALRAEPASARLIWVATRSVATDVNAKRRPRPRSELDAPVTRATPQRLRFAGWVFDLIERHLVAPGGGILPVPGLQFALLRAFVTRPRCVVSRAELALMMHRDGDLHPALRSIDVYVGRLRRTLGRGGSPELISTKRSAGYVFNADVVRV